MEVSLNAQRIERDEALLSLDITKISNYCKKYGVSMPEDEDAYWGGVHKAITGLKNADRQKRLYSVKWLLARGYEHFLDDLTADELIQIALEINCGES